MSEGKKLESPQNQVNDFETPSTPETPDVVKQETNEALAQHEEQIRPVEESMKINTEILGNIKTALEKKLDTDKTEAVIAKIAELTPPTIAANIRSYSDSVKKITNFLGKFGANVASDKVENANNVIEGVAGVVEQVESATEQFTGFKKEITDLYEGLFSSGEVKTVSGDVTIDAAIQEFEQRITELKRQKGIDSAGHHAGLTVALSAFLSRLENQGDQAGVDTGGAVGVAVGNNVENIDTYQEDELGDDNFEYDKNELLPEGLETNQYPIGAPVKNFSMAMVTSKMGPRRAPKSGASTMHRGIDIGIPVGTPILAPANGKVITVKNQPSGAGLYIDVDHGSFITRHMHLSTQEVKVGDFVKGGEQIAKSGNTGNSTGPHLHYEIRYKGEIADPTKKNAKKYKEVDPLHFIDIEGDGKVVAMNKYKLIGEGENLVA